MEFKLSAATIKGLAGGWVEYCVQLEDGGPKVEGNFEAKQEKFEFRHKFTDANSKGLIKEIRKRDLVMKFRKSNS